MSEYVKQITQEADAQSNEFTLHLKGEKILTKSGYLFADCVRADAAEYLYNLHKENDTLKSKLEEAEKSCADHLEHIEKQNRSQMSLLSKITELEKKLSAVRDLLLNIVKEQSVDEFERNVQIARESVVTLSAIVSLTNIKSEGR